MKLQTTSTRQHQHDPRHNPRCNKCGGQFSSGGVRTIRLPVGFGFQHAGKFQVDLIEVKEYTGFCIKCGDTSPVEFSRRHLTRYPESINRKIREARKGL